VFADIKFCGLTRPEDADFAASLRAEYVGVIFAGGPRSRTLEQAMDVFAPVSRIGPRRVGVFADQSPDEIARAADWLQLDVVQLHVTSSVARIEAVRANYDGDIWAVHRVATPALPPELFDLLDGSDGLVLDSFVAGTLGGTGVPMEWSALVGDVNRVRDRLRIPRSTRMGNRPLVLAGGLRPENVGTAIRTLSPSVVDVSSGVESAPGIKDHSRMRAFREAVDALNQP
jgi:phosphoribosylanthranilate isomerase